MLRVRMIPYLDEFNSEGGVKRVIEAYHKYAPKFGIKYVGAGDKADIVAAHFGATGGDVDVAHLHGLIWGESNKESAIANYNIAEACRGASQITVPSEWVAMTLKRDMRLSPHVIPHGIDIDEWKFNNSTKFSYVLWNKNRVDDVCDPTAVTMLASKFIGVKFLTTFARPNNLPNVLDVGLVPHSEMKSMVYGASVYLSTAKETFGIGTLEAMASGCPVLGWDNGGNRDLVQHGVTGYLANYGNYDDLVQGLEYCMTFRDVLGKNARASASEYTWEDAMKKVSEVYELAADKHSREMFNE